MTYKELQALNNRNRKAAKSAGHIRGARLMHFVYDFERCAVQFDCGNSCAEIFVYKVIASIKDGQLYLSNIDLFKSYFAYIERHEQMI